MMKFHDSFRHSLLYHVHRLFDDVDMGVDMDVFALHSIEDDLDVLGRGMQLLTLLL